MSSYVNVKITKPINFLRNLYWREGSLILIAFVINIFCANSHAEEKTIKGAIPLEPENTIIEAFSSHDIVALGEGGHTNEQSHSFRINLVSNPLFQQAVKDIVVEFGNSYYQPMMDRFIAGEEIPHEEVRKAWLYTTQLNQTLDNPVYKEFLYKIRELNRALPEGQKFKVWLGDPPMNWKNINTRDDLNTARKYLNRDGFVVHLIKYEILAKGRKAILLYGDRHFHRKRLYWNFKNTEYADDYSKQSTNSIVNQLEQANAKVFSVTTNTRHDLASIQGSISKWPKPSIAILKGNILGAAPYAEYYPFSVHPINDKGVRVPVKSIPDKSPRMEEEYNAVLYLGPVESITFRKLPKEICLDEEYLKIRLKSLRFMKNEKSLLDFCKNE